MERRIGEIFTYEGEWYQCVENTIGACWNCDLYRTDCRDIACACSPLLRSDKKNVCFKKLEKVGEVEKIDGKFYQKVVSLNTDKGSCVGCSLIGRCKTLPTTCTYPTIYVEIKQNQEDMEENKDEKLSNPENIGKNLKPFDIEKAKSGKPVCTRDGRRARIICFDAVNPLYPLIVLVDNEGIETPFQFTKDGLKSSGVSGQISDLMMLPEKHVGWVNVYKDTGRYKAGVIFPTKGDAINTKRSVGYVTTAKIEWEE